MKQRTVGGSGLRVSHLGVGTWRWGLETDPDEAAAILVAFRDAGGTLVDTAVSYADGGTGNSAEEILGGLLADVVPREELVLAGKGGFRIEDTVDGKVGVVDNSRKRLLDDLDRSLRRLGVDHLDLWQVHVPDADVPIEETLSALDTAVAAGKARYVGVSNFSGWRTAQAATAQSAKAGFAPIVSNQVRYSLLARGVERDVVPACLGLGVGVLPYSPLGGGALTGKYRTGVPADSRAAVGTRHLADLDDPATVGIVEAVATAAEGLGTSPISVSLAWVRDRPAVAAPIIGPRTLGQLTAALAAETLELPPAIRSALDDVSAPLLDYPETVS